MKEFTFKPDEIANRLESNKNLFKIFLLTIPKMRAQPFVS